MPERQSRHPDNELIDAAATPPTPGHQGSAGGNLDRRVGKRAEEHHTLDEDPKVERVTGKDKPQQDAMKGPKTSAAIQSARGGS